MIRLICILVVINIVGIGGLRSQYRYDANFVMGYWSEVGYEDPIVHFGIDSVGIDYQKLRIGFTIASSNISNRNGDLLFYFNGCDLANSSHEIIENGTGFNPGQIATRNCPNNNGYTSVFQSSLTLPLDEKDEQFIILHNTKDYIFEKDTFLFYGIPRYSIVDMSANNGKGKVTVKNQIYLPDTTIAGGNLTAVRHANNKDWWILVLDLEGTNNYYRVLLSDGKLVSQGNQEIGLPWFWESGGQADFSSDGKKYFRYSGSDGLSVMDFDRETGLFSNYRNMPTLQKALFTGASFSPNGRFVYLGNGPSLVQIDIEDDVMQPDTVAIWDGTASSWGQPAWFGSMQTGLDCRIYMTTGFCIPFLHVIMEPDKKGLDCDVRQHMINLEVPTCNIPYFPNYRLGTPYAYCNPEMIVLSSTEAYHFDTALNKVSISPNPTNGLLTISCKANIKDIGISDMSGRTLFNLKGNNTYVQEIDISSLQRGVYFIRTVYGKENYTTVSKVIKVE